PLPVPSADWSPYDRVVRADALDFLRRLPPACAHLGVTSPPHLWKRRYSDDPRELGQEPTAEGYVARLVEIVEEIGRALIPEGSLFLNLGDTYASQPGQYRGDPERHRGISPALVRANGTAPAGRVFDVPEKSLVGVPWRLLLELIQRREWRCASLIAWVREGHAPENVHDRVATGWEPVLVLTRAHHAYSLRAPGEDDVWAIRVGGGANRNGDGAAGGGDGQRHLAPYPEALAERAISRACRPGGVVLDPFAGSGTTLRVATRLGRRFLGCDLLPGEAP